MSYFKLKPQDTWYIISLFLYVLNSFFLNNINVSLDYLAWLVTRSDSLVCGAKLCFRDAQ